MNSSLLDQIYEHLDESDWLEGVDIYQAGRVLDLKTFNGLITGKVSAEASLNTEVRLKLHPTGRCIQWIECTCRKNRASSHYCEHIAALMIHLDREQPQVLAKLDLKMPLKPPASVRKPRLMKEKDPDLDDSVSKEGGSRGAAHTILSHLVGSIHSVALIGSGPRLRIKIEIKSGQLTHYDLDLDAAARFFLTLNQREALSKEAENLQVFQDEAELGTRIYAIDSEKIVAERTIALSPLKGRKIKATDGDEDYKHAFFRLKAGEGGPPEKRHLIFLPVKASSKFLGNDYFFLPEYGYWPLAKSVKPSWKELSLQKIYKDDAAAELVKNGFSEYIDLGTVWIEESLFQPEIIEMPELSEVHLLSEGNGWFHLDPRYGTGTTTISMAELIRQFRKKKRLYFKTKKGWLKIPEFVTKHNWDFDESGEHLKVDSVGLLRLKAAIGDFDRFAGSKKLLNQIRSRFEFTPANDLPALKHTNLQLRAYQEDGVRWFWWLYRNRLHGLLADEMGLGKTHQAMALLSAIQAESEDAFFIVICPTTVLSHWEDKVAAFCPNLSPVVYHGAKRLQILKSVGKKYKLLITSYGILLRDIQQLSTIKWSAVILDEAHFVKNNSTATYQSACRLQANIRICLSGTPIENNLGELKNLFDFLVPGYLGSDDYFKREFIQPIMDGKEHAPEFTLQKLIHPFKLRRTKDQVLPDLPAKVEDIKHCSLSEEQIKLYRDIVALKAAPLIRQLANETNPIPYLHVFATISYLKQICDHPALILDDNSSYEKHESGKFELLKQILEEALGSGHKIVIYSQYLGMIAIFEDYLKSVGIEYVSLTGQTRNRGEIIARFQEDANCRVFCGSLMAGGIGIDLTAASVVIHYDRWWNASKENQATGRVHRIGQNKNVQVLKLVTKGTLEEKIDQRINAKQATIEKFLDKDEELFRSFSRQELIELLQ